MSQSLSPAGAYWFYAVCAALAAVLGVTVLPETKVSFREHLESINITFQGKTLADVSQEVSRMSILKKPRHIIISGEESPED